MANFLAIVNTQYLALVEDNGNRALRGVANATWAWQPADELMKFIRGKLRPAYYNKIIALASVLLVRAQKKTNSSCESAKNTGLFTLVVRAKKKNSSCESAKKRKCK